MCTASTFLLSILLIKKELNMHPRAAGSTAFSGLRHYPGPMGNRYLSDKERNVILAVESFCKKKGVELEVIDLATKGFLTKIKFRVKGLMNFPTISFKEKVVHGVPTEETLKKLVAT